MINFSPFLDDFVKVPHRIVNAQCYIFNEYVKRKSIHVAQLIEYFSEIIIIDVI